MLEKIYRLLELIAIVICLHNFYGKKFKIDIYCIGYVVFELILMQLMQDNYLSSHMYFVVYLIYFIYAYIKFEKVITHTILNCLLSVLTIGILQMIAYMPMCFLHIIMPEESAIILLINLAVCILISITRKSTKYKKVADFCMSNEWILRISVFICIAVMLYCMYTIKSSTAIQIDIFVLMNIFAALVFIIIYRWQKANYEIKKKEKELQITNFYNEAYEDLINVIRIRQHDFNNHIDAIYGMHLTAKSMDELIESQEDYCDKILLENRYSKVLSSIKNSVLAGFIYTKFTKIEENGIEIIYDLFYTGKGVLISIYHLIEIIGILLDNASEAVAGQEVDKSIFFEMKDEEKQFEISVKNPITHLSNNDISKFFEKGYSTKGQGRGIGLSKLKDFRKKYKFDIMVHTYEENKKEWIEFKIIEKK